MINLSFVALVCIKYLAVTMFLSTWNINSLKNACDAYMFLTDI